MIIPISTVSAEQIELDTTIFTQSTYDLKLLAESKADEYNIDLNSYDYFYETFYFQPFSENRLYLIFLPKGKLSDGSIKEYTMPTGILGYSWYMSRNENYYYTNVSAKPPRTIDVSSLSSKRVYTVTSSSDGYTSLVTTSSGNYPAPTIIYASDTVIDDAGNTLYEGETLEINVLSTRLVKDVDDYDLLIHEVDFSSGYNENYIYQYSYDNIHFYDLTVDPSSCYNFRQGIDLTVYLRVLNTSSEVIYTTTIQGLPYDPDYEKIKRKPIITETYTKDGEKAIQIDMDFTPFTHFSDMYNIKIYVEGELLEGDTKTVIYTEANYQNAIEYKVYIDDLELSYLHRVASTISGGGSDFDFLSAYNQIIEYELTNELNGTNTIHDFGDYITVISNFIAAIRDLIAEFFSLILYFFNKLNIWIRAFLIASFVHIVLCKTFKTIKR